MGFPLLAKGENRLETSPKTVSIFLVGPGRVGGTLLDQIASGHDALLDRFGIDIRVVGMANSKNLYFDPEGIPLSEWRAVLPSCSCPMDWDVYFNLMANSQVSIPIFVDCTANQTIASAYPAILGSQIPIVTSNHQADWEAGVPFIYDASEGANLFETDLIASRSLEWIVKIGLQEK